MKPLLCNLIHFSMCIIIWQLQELIGGQFTTSAYYHSFLPIWLLLCDGLKVVMTCNMTTLLTARYSSLLGLDSFPHPIFPCVMFVIYFLISLTFFLSHFSSTVILFLPFPSLYYSPISSPFSSLPPYFYYFSFLLFHIGSFSARPVVL